MQYYLNWIDVQLFNYYLFIDINDLLLLLFLDYNVIISFSLPLSFFKPSQEPLAYALSNLWSLFFNCCCVHIKIDS